MTATVRQDRDCVGSRCSFRKQGQTGCPCYSALVYSAARRAEREAIERDRVIAITHDARLPDIPVAKSLEELVADYRAMTGTAKKKKGSAVQASLF